MTCLFHVSDLHFGAEDREALDWFSERTRAVKPDAVIVTGDLTMRARRREFAAAAIWLDQLQRPLTVEVGNHDLPYFNLWARFMTPYRRFQAIEGRIEKPLDIAGIAVIPLKTTARFQFRLNWSKGRVGEAALDDTLAQIAARAPGEIVLIAAHHPLIEAGTMGTAHTQGGAAALAALAQHGVAAVLTGHVHDPFDVAHESNGRTVRLIGAGTLSERVRSGPPSYNEIRIEDGAISVIARRLGEADTVLEPLPG